MFSPHEEFQELMHIIQDMRETLGFSFPITSGYRCSSHPIVIEKLDKKGKAGYHHTSAAIDIGVSRENAFRLLEESFKRGFTGIGINQKGDHRFIHLDMRRKTPALWSY